MRIHICIVRGSWLRLPVYSQVEGRLREAGEFMGAVDTECGGQRDELLLDYVRLILDAEYPRRAWRILAGSLALVSGVAGVVTILWEDVPDQLRTVGWLLLGLAGFVAFVMLAVLPVWTVLKRNRVLEDAVASPSALHEACLLKYGFLWETRSSQATLHLDGSFTETATVHVRSVDAQVLELGHYSQSGRTADPKAEVTASILRANYDKGEVLERIVDQTEHMIEWVATFSPEMGPGDQAEYVYQEDSAADSFLMDNESVRKLKLGFESWSIPIKYPCRQLTMRILLPWQPEQREVDVWCDRGVQKNVDEIARLRTGRCLKGDWTQAAGGRAYAITLVVDYPVLGLSYAIKWRPPASAPKRPGVAVGEVSP